MTAHDTRAETHGTGRMTPRNPSAVRTREDVSDDARRICGRYFSMGLGSEVKSHPPHETVQREQAAWDELVAAGIVTMEPFNRYGVMLYRSTERAQEIGREEMQKHATDMFGGSQ